MPDQRRSTGLPEQVAQPLSCDVKLVAVSQLMEEVIQTRLRNRWWGARGPGSWRGSTAAIGWKEGAGRVKCDKGRPRSRRASASLCPSGELAQVRRCAQWQTQTCLHPSGGGLDLVSAGVPPHSRTGSQWRAHAMLLWGLAQAGPSYPDGDPFTGIGELMKALMMAALCL